MQFVKLEDDERALLDYLRNQLEQHGQYSVPVADAAAALGWSFDACVSAAYGLDLEGLVHLSNGGADRITLSRDGQAYLAAEKRASEMVWACQYCGHAEKTKQALRTHSATCPLRPKGKGNMGF